MASGGYQDFKVTATPQARLEKEPVSAQRKAACKRRAQSGLIRSAPRRVVAVKPRRPHGDPNDDAGVRAPTDSLFDTASLHAKPSCLCTRQCNTLFQDDRRSQTRRKESGNLGTSKSSPRRRSARKTRAARAWQQPDRIRNKPQRGMLHGDDPFRLVSELAQDERTLRTVRLCTPF